VFPHRRRRLKTLQLHTVRYCVNACIRIYAELLQRPEQLTWPRLAPSREA